MVNDSWLVVHGSRLRFVARGSCPRKDNLAPAPQERVPLCQTEKLAHQPGGMRVELRALSHDPLTSDGLMNPHFPGSEFTTNPIGQQAWFGASENYSKNI